MTADSTLNSLAITDEDIAEYLRGHKDFFINRPSLLADLELPHQAGGGTVSLVERQVSVLRERNMDMRHRLDALLENARTNDKLFEKTKRLILSLLEAQDINDFIDALLYSFENDFDIQHTTLLLFTDAFNKEETLAAKDAVQLLPLGETQAILGTIITNNQTVCGQLDTQEQALLFQDKASDIGSTAIAPLAAAQPLGILAIGHSDPDHYRCSMSTLFLSYIGEVLSRLLPQHLS